MQFLGPAKYATISTLALTLALMVSSALANPQTTSTRTYTYDGAGKQVHCKVTHFDHVGDLTSSTEIAYTHGGPKRFVIAEEHSFFDAGGTQTGTALMTFERGRDGKLTSVDRLWIHSDGTQKRREEERWIPQADGRSTLRETFVFNGRDERIETRYGIVLYNARSQVLSSDISTFNSEGLQTGRVLTDFEYSDGLMRTREQTYFDENDEIAKRIVERHQYDAKRRLVEKTARYLNSRGEVTQEAVDSKRYDALSGRLVGRTYSFYNPDGAILRRLTETLRHTDRGQLVSRVGSWEYF